MATQKNQVLLEDPEIDVDTILDGGGVMVSVGGVSINVPPTEFSPRVVRRFLWDNRKDRSILRSRSILEINHSESSVELVIKALTHRDAATRLELS